MVRSLLVPLFLCLPFRVVRCAPEWARTMQGVGALIHNVASQSPPIVVRVPTSMNSRMRDGIAAAVAAWNAALWTSGFPTAPTLSDHWPVSQSTYSGYPTLVCR